MQITAYVPCHNGENTLPEVLQALKAQTRPANQYLLIDDRSTDRSPVIARDYGFETQATGPNQFGLAVGRNVALRHARGDVLVGVDADVIAAPNCLAEIETQFARSPELAGLCGCLKEEFTDTPADLWRSRHMSQHYGDAELPNPPILYGSTSAHRTEVVRGLGGWDASFRTNYEDADLTVRLQKAGLRTLYWPGCRLWHLRRDTVESVLKGFWQWHSQGAVGLGLYNSLKRWKTQRLPGIWQDYRIRWAFDHAVPQSASITCLLPWAMMLRDLHQVNARSRTALDLNEVANLASGVLQQSGATSATAAWVGRWLHALAAGLSPLAGRPTTTANGLLTVITQAALEGAPDETYWAAVQSMLSLIA